MGAIHVPVTIHNPVQRYRFWEGIFLVDTGATDCLVPRGALESIGLLPVDQQVYELADGSDLRMDVTAALVEFMGKAVGANVIMSDTDAEPLLGVTALESAGIEVDPRNERLKRLPSIRLKGLRNKCCCLQPRSMWSVEIVC